jgi:hypothetical protein
MRASCGIASHHGCVAAGWQLKRELQRQKAAFALHAQRLLLRVGHRRGVGRRARGGLRLAAALSLERDRQLGGRQVRAGVLVAQQAPRERGGAVQQAAVAAREGGERELADAVLPADQRHAVSGRQAAVHVSARVRRVDAGRRRQRQQHGGDGDGACGRLGGRDVAHAARRRRAARPAALAAAASLRVAVGAVIRQASGIACVV